MGKRISRWSTWWPLAFLVFATAAVPGLRAAPVAAATSPYTAVDLGTLGGASSSAAAINEAGVVVGTSAVASGQSAAFLWTPTGGMHDFGTGVSSSAVDINNAGQIVGNWVDPASNQMHAFLWTPAHGTTDLGTLGGATSSAAKINNAGEVVGSARTASGQVHAFLWTPDDGMIDLGGMGGVVSQATGINDDGTVVGVAADASFVPHAFVWTRAGGMIEFNLGTETDVHAINNAGQIGGNWIVPTPSGGTTFHGFLWTPSVGTVDVGTIGLSYSYGLDLNDSGQLVGFFRVAAPGTVERAYVWTQAGGPIDLGTLGGINSRANGLNDADQIVGSAQMADGATHATLWQLAGSTPPAAPSAPDLAAAGDSGASDVDNVTWRQSLIFEGTAEKGTTVTLYRGTAAVGTRHADVFSGTWVIPDTVTADGKYSYTATATDAAGNTSPASAALVVTVDTHAPVLAADGLTADANSPYGAAVPYVVAATDTMDPSPAVTCSPAAGSLFAIGDTTLNCTAVDLAGNTATASFVVHVRGASEQASALAELVIATDAKQGILSSLDAKLGALQQALGAANAGSRSDAVNKLGAFMNDVTAQSGRALTQQQASQLIAAAQQIQATLG